MDLQAKLGSLVALLTQSESLRQALGALSDRSRVGTGEMKALIEQSRGELDASTKAASSGKLGSAAFD